VREKAQGVLTVRVLAPARVVTAPDGSRWEIYVSRFKMPAWRPTDHEAPPPAVGGAALLFGIVDMILSIVYDVLVPLLWIVVTTPAALIRGSTSHRRRIVALTFWPHEERYVWEASSTDVDRVVHEISDGLEHGSFVQPAEAVFFGRQV
jgi:hypothetical protein